MAILRGGLFGNISGKIGGLVFSTRNNQTEVRNLPKKYEGPVTEVALNTRAKLTLLAGFLKLFMTFIRIGYPKKPKQYMSAFNAAFSENHHCIINGAYPNLEIDYSKVTFSKGHLDGLSGLTIDPMDDELFNVKWNTNVKWHQCPTSDGCDRIYCILYDPIDKRIIEVSAGAIRNDCHFVFFLPEEMAGKKIHMYVFLHSCTKRAVSRTQYQCLDLRKPAPIEKVRSVKTSGNTTTDEDVEARKEKLRNVTKCLTIPKAPKMSVPKKKQGRIRKSVRDYTRDVLNEGIGGMRKSIRQKRP